MGDAWPFVVVAIVLGIGITAFRILRRRRKDYREVIEPELQRHGYEFVSSSTPRFFSVGPFPIFEFEVGGVQTMTPIGSGEYTVYRIVRYRKAESSEELESWVMLNFEAFMLKRTVWKPELD